MIDRAAPNDLMELVSDVGPVPMHIAALLLLEAPPAVDLETAAAVLGSRAGTVPRLRQRLVRAPFGCGRAVWVDDAHFDARRHITERACAPPGDERALLDTAVAVVTTPLPRSRPLWSATFVTGLGEGRVALVLVLHHVLADGMGGLAVLGTLADGEPHSGTPAETRFPRPAPSWIDLAADAWSSRLHAPARLPAGLSTLRAALAELGTGRPRMAPRTSLNRPTGARRRLGVVCTDLGAVVATAHAHESTVNDVVLAAIIGALATLLDGRGETAPSLVVSMPVSARPAAGSAQLGNRVGAIPVTLPTGGEPSERLRAVASITRARKSTSPGASAAVLQPVFRALAALGLLDRFVNRQRLVNTFVTNLRGPTTPMSFMGARVGAAIPISGTYGNVTVSFAALSYAGTLVLTVIADPDAVPDLAVLVTALRHELAALTQATGAR